MRTWGIFSVLEQEKRRWLVRCGRADHYVSRSRRWVSTTSWTASSTAGSPYPIGIGRGGTCGTLLESWMQTYVRVRNICAHHGRLWNVGLGVYPAIPTSPTVSWLERDGALPERSRTRLYPVLVSLQSVLDSVSPRSGWARRLHRLLGARPPMNLRGMGVPVDWADDPFWSRRIS